MRTTMNIHAQAIVVALAVFSTVARAESPPPAAPPKPFTVPPRHDLATDNGGKITLVAYGESPKALVQWVVRAGNAQENDNQVWLADLTARLIHEGSKTQDAEKLAQAAAAMGGNFDIFATPDETVVSMEVLAELTPQAIALVADVIRNPAFPASELPRLKNDLVREMAVSKSRPQTLAREQFDAALFPHHPYGRYFPTLAMLNGYTLEDAKKFYDDNYGAARSHLYVVGRFDAAAAETAARNAVADWRRGPDVAEMKPAAATAAVMRVVDRPGALQSTLIVGVPVVSPSSDDFVPLQVVDSLLGGSFGSRITSNIREQKGYTYSPRSSVEPMDHNTTWSEQADVTTKDTGASLTEIFKEVSRLRAEAPTAAELDGIKRYLAGTFVLRNSTRWGIVTQLRFVDLQRLSDDWLRSYVEKVTAMTPDAVRKIADRYFDPKKMTIAVVGDRKLVDKQLLPWKKLAAK
jgi:zinc protease